MLNGRAVRLFAAAVLSQSQCKAVLYKVQSQPRHAMLAYVYYPSSLATVGQLLQASEAEVAVVFSTGKANTALLFAK